MFNKRNEPESGSPEPTSRAPEPPPAAPRRGSSGGQPATIGPSICIRGDLSGDEDLIVQGQVEGTVTLPNNLVTIGQDGRVSATVNARVIHVEGTVDGDLNGDEQVILQRSGKVRGNITSPRVTIEDGCTFRGSIDMDVGVDARSKGAGKVADIKPAAGGSDDAKAAAAKKS